MSYNNNIEINTIRILLSVIIIMYENSIYHIICGSDLSRCDKKLVVDLID